MIEKYIGVNYEFGKNDCVSIVADILNEAGYNIYYNEEKNKKWYLEKPNLIIDYLKEHGKKIDIKDIKKFDIVVFEFEGVTKHIGVMIDRSRFLHARTNKKSAITRLRHYKKYINSVWRLEG